MSDQLRLDVQAPMRLRLGDVVTKTPDGPRSEIRGVVTALDDEGWLGKRKAVVWRAGSTTHTDHGIGDGPEDWTLVPYEDQTWEERVRSAAAKWTPVHPSWSEAEDFAWAMMTVFVPEFDESDDWPTDFFELAVHYARHLDRYGKQEFDAIVGHLELTALQLDSVSNRLRDLRQRPQLWERAGPGPA